VGRGGTKRVNCEIFTTNYDRVLEAYCRRMELEYECGEAPGQQLNISESNSRLFDPYEPVHKIYKIHGSIKLNKKPTCLIGC
jgi:hypothetical protein